MGEGLQGLSCVSALSNTAGWVGENNVSPILGSELRSPHSVQAVGGEPSEERTGVEGGLAGPASGSRLVLEAGDRALEAVRAREGQPGIRARPD